MASEARDAAAPSSAITLAIPYYSQYEYLLTTARSLAKQTHREVRVLICDDSPKGLEPPQVESLARLFEGHFPFRLLRNERNLGMARTWNRCIDEADTDLITIVHGDDELEPTYAESMVALAHAHPEAAAVFAGARIIDEASEAAFSFPDFYKTLLVPAHGDALVLRGDRALASLLRGNYIFCPSLCYRRSRLGARRFNPDYKMVLDIDLTMSLLLAGETLVGVPKRPLYRYRRHAENATQHLTKDSTRFREESAYYRDVADRARALGFERSARVAARKRIIKLNLLFCIVRDVRGRDLRGAREKLALLREVSSTR